MQNESVRKYYDILCKRRFSFFVKRAFDIFAGIILLVCLIPAILILSIVIKMDSHGPVLFRQVRVTQYGRPFKIYKFRTMVNNAEKQGTQVTVGNDCRVTRIGRILRDYRLDDPNITHGSVVKLS
jgi:lipopolysaccharide/colanic/teichoic acid biosynthesis glycosyltransferase